MGRSLDGNGSGEKVFLLFVTVFVTAALRLHAEVRIHDGPWQAVAGITGATEVIEDDGPEHVEAGMI